MLRKKLFRDLWHYKGQFFTIFLMVFIGMLAFSGIHGYMDGMDESAREYYQSYNLQDLWITNTNVSDSDLETLKSMDHISDVNRALVLNAKLKGYKDVTLETNVLEENTISKMYVVKGEKYASNKKGLWFDSYLAEYLNIHVGDTLKLDISGKTLKLKVKGLVNTPDHVYFVKDSTEIFPTHQNYGFIYMSADTFQDAMNMDVTYNKAYVDVDKESCVSSVKKEIQKKFDFLSVTDRDASFSYAGYQSEVEEGQTYAPVFTGLFLMIAILSVMSTMNRFVRQQRVQIGTLKALGFKNRKIYMHYIGFGFMISLIAAILGVVIGYLTIGQFFIDMEASYFEMPNIHMTLLPVVILTAILVVLMISLVTYLSSRKILKETASEALRLEVPRVKKNSLDWSVKFNKCKLSTRWNLRDIARNKGRSIAACVGIIGCTMLLVCSFGLWDTIESYMDWEYKVINTYQYKISLNSDYTKEQYDHLTDLYGDATSKSVAIEFENHGKTETRSMLVSDGKDKLNITDHDEKVMSLHSNGIYLTEKLAEKYGVQVGDTIKWHLTGDSTWHTSKVVGLNRDPQTQQFTMSKKYFEKLGYTYRPDSIYTNEKAKKIDGVSKISSIESIQEGVESMLEAMKSMMVLLIVFAVLLGCVILYNLGVLSFTEKQYQFATLKVLGFKDKQIKEIFIKQNTWIMLVGMIIGLPLGYQMLSYIYTNALNDTYDFPAVVEWISYVYAIIGTILVSYVMNKLLARKIKTIDMVSSLKANE